MPGTDLCLKIGGFLRTEWDADAGGSLTTFTSGANAQYSRGGDLITSRSRAVLSFDAREQSSYGTIRAYAAGGWNYTSNDAPTLKSSGDLRSFGRRRRGRGRCTECQQQRLSAARLCPVRRLHPRQDCIVLRLLRNFEIYLPDQLPLPGLRRRRRQHLGLYPEPGQRHIGEHRRSGQHAVRPSGQRSQCQHRRSWHHCWFRQHLPNCGGRRTYQ